MNEERKVWGIHTKDDALFMRDNVIAIGWKAMGDLSVLVDRTAFKEKYAEIYPDAPKQNVLLRRKVSVNSFVMAINSSFS